MPSTEHKQLFQRLARSLRNDHPAMQSERNPVLHGLQSQRMTGRSGLVAVGQYVFLPSRIVGILSSISQRLQVWPYVHEELERNIDEETGAKTNGEAHFSILRRCLATELGLEFDPSGMHPVTQQFLAALDEAIETKPPAFVAGMSYALEDSALPELEIVAYAINAAWQAAGNQQLIQPSRLKNRKQCEAIQRDKTAAEYTLEDFFVVHLQDFEVGHEEGLRKTVAAYLNTAAEIDAFEEGFEFTLAAMDEWWAGMASIS